MDGCIFCKIASKEIESNVVYEDDHVLAFDDVNPQAPVHTLIIPKRHVGNHLMLAEEHAGLLGKLHAAVNEVAHSKGIDESGFRIVINCNPDAGETVPHLHFHVVGGRPLVWPPG
jgi:histidine triad (HIT) family protein